MQTEYPRVCLGEVLNHRSEFFRIDDFSTYKRVTAKLHAKGIVLRDEIKGFEIKTKKQQRCKAGDFLVAEIDAKVGGYGIVPPDLEGAIVSSHYYLYEIDESKLERQYLHYCIQADAFQNQITAQGSTNYASVRPVDILEIEIPLPPLDEQQRIAAILDRLMERIDEARRQREAAIEDLNIVIQKTLDKVLFQFSRYQDLSNMLLEKPKNGYSVKCDDIEGGTPVLTLASVTGFNYTKNFKLTSEILDPDAKYWLNPGDLLISRSNTLDLVGHAAIYSGDPYPCVYPDLLMKLQINPEKAESKFVLYWLQTSVVRNYIKEHAKGTSPTMKKISQSIVMAIPFPADTSLTTQREIAYQFDQMQAKKKEIHNLQTETEKDLEDLIPSLLQKAFAGEL